MVAIPATEISPEQACRFGRETRPPQGSTTRPVLRRERACHAPPGRTKLYQGRGWHSVQALPCNPKPSHQRTTGGTCGSPSALPGLTPSLTRRLPYALGQDLRSGISMRTSQCRAKRASAPGCPSGRQAATSSRSQSRSSGGDAQADLTSDTPSKHANCFQLSIWNRATRRRVQAAAASTWLTESAIPINADVLPARPEGTRLPRAGSMWQQERLKLGCIKRNPRSYEERAAPLVVKKMCCKRKECGSDGKAARFCTQEFR